MGTRGSGRTRWQILLVGENEEQAVLHFTVAQYALELVLGLVDALAVLGVDDEDKALSAGIVVPPEGTDLVLATDVPNVELDVLVGDGLDVETDGGNSRHGLVKFELVENRCAHCICYFF